MTYGAPVNTLTYGAPAMTYAAPTMTYGAPMPVAGQTYTISPERFQLILQGQPLTTEEINAMTGGASAAVPVQTEQPVYSAPAASTVVEVVEPVSEIATA